MCPQKSLHACLHDHVCLHCFMHARPGGATGCGKSTQVPQFILDDAIRQGAGSSANIVVTQPRRISALGLAQRVAQERGEAVREGWEHDAAPLPHMTLLRGCAAHAERGHVHDPITKSNIIGPCLTLPLHLCDPHTCCASCTGGRGCGLQREDGQQEFPPHAPPFLHDRCALGCRQAALGVRAGAHRTGLARVRLFVCCACTSRIGS